MDKKKDDNDDENNMSEDSNLSLEKDDEDYLEFDTFKPKDKKKEKSKDKDKDKDKESLKKEEKSLSDKSKKSVDMTDIINPYLYRKRSRSFNSSNSDDSNKKNKNKKIFKELTGFQKAYVGSQKENFEKNYKVLKDDIKLLEEYERKIFKDTILYIMFIMDLTGSMSVWLEEAQNSIKNIIEEITDNNPGSKIRVSFIGYRDFLEINETRNYENKEFTEDINEIYNFISKLSCWGGGDVPEDIVGALNEALKMKWESNSKYAILVCDAPCHGKQYHTISYDRFEHGDPSGTTLEDTMKQFLNKGITFYCLEIDSSTEKMFKIMKDVYNDDNKFHIEKIWNSNQFSFFVTFSASVLLSNSKYSKYKFKEIISNYRKESIENMMKKYINNNIKISDNSDSTTMDLINQIENLELGGEDKKLFDFINRMSDLNINNSGNNNIININNNNNNNNNLVEIQLCQFSTMAFDEKEINYNLRGLTYNKNLNIVNDWVNPSIQEKEYKTQLIISYKTLKKENSEYQVTIYDNKLDKQSTGRIPLSIDKKLYDHPSIYIKDLSYNELICEQIGDYFNVLIDQKLPYLKQFIKFKKHFLYEMSKENNLIDDNFYRNNRYIISEELVPSRLSYTMPLEDRTLQCFSHFSYQLSGGQLLITDFSYDKEINKVTDFKIYFLKDNEYKNILEFFASHICDNTCRTLELCHPRKKNNPIEIKEEFFSTKYTTDTILCDCCSVPIHNKDKDNLHCEYCSINATTSKYKAICSQCNLPFFYSTYACNCNLTNYPSKCQKCNGDF